MRFVKEQVDLQPIVDTVFASVMTGWSVIAANWHTASSLHRAVPAPSASPYRRCWTRAKR